MHLSKWIFTTPPPPQVHPRNSKGECLSVRPPTLPWIGTVRIPPKYISTLFNIRSLLSESPVLSDRPDRILWESMRWEGFPEWTLPQIILDVYPNISSENWCKMILNISQSISLMSVLLQLFLLKRNWYTYNFFILLYNICWTQIGSISSWWFYPLNLFTLFNPKNILTLNYEWWPEHYLIIVSVICDPTFPIQTSPTSCGFTFVYPEWQDILKNSTYVSVISR